MACMWYLIYCITLVFHGCLHNKIHVFVCFCMRMCLLSNEIYVYYVC